MFYPNLLRGRHDRTLRSLDLGVSQRKMLASMLREPERGWTAQDFSHRLGVQPQVARTSLLRLHRRGLVRKVIPARHGFVLGSGRLPHLYYLSGQGRRVAQEQCLLTKF